MNKTEKKYKQKYEAKVDELLNMPIKQSGDWKIISQENLGLSPNWKMDEFLKEYISWVYANVTAVAEAVSTIELKLFKVKGDNVGEVKEHPILELLYQVNPYMTKSDFIFNLQANLLLTGEAPIRLKRNNPKNINDKPTELYPISPTKLKIFTGKTKDGYEILQKYQITERIQGKVETLELNPWEVIFIKNINPNNIWRGVGVVEAGATSIDTMNFAEAYNLNFFKNAAVPYTVLYTDQKLNKDIIERLKDAWNVEYKGYRNAFKTAVLEAGLKAQTLQTSAKDMDFLEQQRFLRDKLMAMFKTTKIALGITEDVNRANAEASEYVFMKNCVRPKMRKLIEYLNEFLLPVFDKRGELFLDFVDPVPQDRVSKIAEYAQAVDKWLTKNEIREEEGLPPLEGGDEIYQPIALQPLGTTPPEKLEVNPIEQPEEEIEEEIEELKGYRILRPIGKRKLKDYREQIARLKNRNLMIKQLKAQVREIAKMMVQKQKPIEVKKITKYSGNVKQKSQVDKYIKSLQFNQTRFENQMSEDLSDKYFGWQLKQIKNKLNRKGLDFLVKRPKKALIKQIGDEFMFNQKKSVKIGIDLITPLIEEILLTQGQEALDFLNLDMTYDLLEEARKYLNKEPIKLSKTMTETSYIRARKSIADGIEKGESIPQLIKRIEATYKDIKKYHAENIARTEVTRATNFATIDGYKQSGVVKGKEWIVTPDDRLCQYCLAMESTYNAKLGLNETYFKIGDIIEGVDGGTFEVDYSDIEAPPLHNQCRCDTIPILDEIKTVEPKNKEDELLNDMIEQLKEENGTN